MNSQEENRQDLDALQNNIQDMRKDVADIKQYIKHMEKVISDYLSKNADNKDRQN